MRKKYADACVLYFGCACVRVCIYVLMGVCSLHTDVWCTDNIWAYIRASAVDEGVRE